MNLTERLDRAALAAGVCAMAIGALAGCGDSSGGDSGGQSAAGAHDRTAAAEGVTDRSPEPQRKGGGIDGAGGGGSPVPGSPGGTGASTPDASAGDGDASADGREVAVERVVTGMYSSFAAGDAGGVCRVMSREARDDIAQQVPGGSTVPARRRTCQQSLDKFLDIAAQSGMLERTLSARVEDVEIAGATATATVDIGGQQGEVQLIEEDGHWVFGRSPVGAGN